MVTMRTGNVAQTRGDTPQQMPAAQVRQTLRQPHSNSIHAASGQPMELAKPVFKLMPVIAPRER